MTRRGTADRRSGGEHAELVTRYRTELCARYRAALAILSRSAVSLAPVFGVSPATATRWGWGVPPVGVVHWLEAVVRATAAVPVPDLDAGVPVSPKVQPVPTGAIKWPGIPNTPSPPFRTIDVTPEMIEVARGLRASAPIPPPITESVRERDSKLRIPLSDISDLIQDCIDLPTTVEEL